MIQQPAYQKSVGRLALLLPLLLLSVLLGLAGASSLLADDDDDEFDAVPNQIVVKLAPGVSIDRINLAYGTTTLEALVAGRPIYLLATPEGTAIERLISRLDRDRRIRYAEPNFYLEQPEIDRRSA